MNKFKAKQKARYIQSDFLLRIDVKVLQKSTLGTCENPYTTNLALNLATDLLR